MDRVKWICPGEFVIKLDKKQCIYCVQIITTKTFVNISYFLKDN